MAELAALLGTIAVLLTFVSSYRLFEFVTSGSPALGLLVSSGITVSFMLVFEYVLVLFGLAALAAPFGIIYYQYGRVPGLSPAVERALTRAKRQAGINVVKCDGCETVNETSNGYCKNCGRKLEGSSG